MYMTPQERQIEEAYNLGFESYFDNTPMPKEYANYKSLEDAWLNGEKDAEDNENHYYEHHFHGEDFH